MILIIPGALVAIGVAVAVYHIIKVWYQTKEIEKTPVTFELEIPEREDVRKSAPIPLSDRVPGGGSSAYKRISSGSNNILQSLNDPKPLPPYRRHQIVQMKNHMISEFTAVWKKLFRRRSPPSNLEAAILVESGALPATIPVQSLSGSIKSLSISAPPVLQAAGRENTGYIPLSSASFVDDQRSISSLFKIALSDGSSISSSASLAESNDLSQPVDEPPKEADNLSEIFYPGTPKTSPPPTPTPPPPQSPKPARIPLHIKFPNDENALPLMSPGNRRHSRTISKSSITSFTSPRSLRSQKKMTSAPGIQVPKRILADSSNTMSPSDLVYADIANTHSQNSIFGNDATTGELLKDCGIVDKGLKVSTSGVEPRKKFGGAEDKAFTVFVD